MLWYNFILGFKLCFPLFQTHYHTDYPGCKQSQFYSLPFGQAVASM